MARTSLISDVRVREIDDRVLLAALAGRVDTVSIRALNDRLHAEISSRRAHVVILDLTGLPAIDADTAHELLNTAAVVRLMGCRVVVLGAALRGIDTVASAAEAVEISRRETGALQAR
jgi:rsbT co-antagonist protein RsbR